MLIKRRICPAVLTIVSLISRVVVIVKALLEIRVKQYNNVFVHRQFKAAKLMDFWDSNAEIFIAIVKFWVFCCCIIGRTVRIRVPDVAWTEVVMIFHKSCVNLYGDFFINPARTYTVFFIESHFDWHARFFINTASNDNVIYKWSMNWIEFHRYILIAWIS